MSNDSIFNGAVVPLNSRYKVSLSAERHLVVDEDRSSSCLRDSFNFHLLCGRNGSGKTLILQSIHNPNRHDAIVVLRSNNAFLSSREMRIVYDGVEYQCNIRGCYDVRLTDISIEHEVIENSGITFRKRFLRFYVDNMKLFDDIDPELMTHFLIDKSDEWQDVHNIDDYVSSRFSKYGLKIFSIDTVWKKSLLDAIFLSSVGDNTFDRWMSLNDYGIKRAFSLSNESDLKAFQGVRRLIFEEKEDAELVSLFEELSLIVFGEGEKAKQPLGKGVLGLVNFEIPKPKAYPLGAWVEVVTRFDKICKDICDIFDRAYSRAGLAFSREHAVDLFWFRPFRRYAGGGERYLEGLSGGEYMAVKMRYSMFMRVSQGECAILLEDEPDRSFHPEWARCFKETYLVSLRKILEYLSGFAHRNGWVNRSYSIVMASHSPLVLSDFYNEDVTFLEKVNGVASIVERGHECFAGNIGELLLDNFFVARTIGSYAENAIRKIVADINDGKIFNSDVEIARAKCVISKIGDKVLRAILNDQLERGAREANRSN